MHFHLLDTITAIQVKGVIETSIHTNQNARWNAAEGLHGEVLRQRKNKNEWFLSVTVMKGLQSWQLIVQGQKGTCKLNGHELSLTSSPRFKEWGWYFAQAPSYPTAFAYRRYTNVEWWVLKNLIQVLLILITVGVVFDSFPF